MNLSTSFFLCRSVRFVHSHYEWYSCVAPKTAIVSERKTYVRQQKMQKLLFYILFLWLLCIFINVCKKFKFALGWSEILKLRYFVELFVCLTRPRSTWNEECHTERSTGWMALLKFLHLYFNSEVRWQNAKHSTHSSLNSNTKSTSNSRALSSFIWKYTILLIKYSLLEWR